VRRRERARGRGRGGSGGISTPSSFERCGASGGHLGGLRGGLRGGGDVSRRARRALGGAGVEALEVGVHHPRVRVVLLHRDERVLLFALLSLLGVVLARVFVAPFARVSVVRAAALAGGVVLLLLALVRHAQAATLEVRRLQGLDRARGPPRGGALAHLLDRALHALAEDEHRLPQVLAVAPAEVLDDVVHVRDVVAARVLLDARHELGVAPDVPPRGGSAPARTPGAPPAARFALETRHRARDPARRPQTTRAAAARILLPEREKTTALVDARATR
jgi:hypothetical protein